jgi:hypothetical protein
MTVVRRFLLASSLARLIARDRGSNSITEGYFAGQQGRVSYVALDAERAGLVLTSEAAGSAPMEERTEIPRAHAEALLDVCAGRLSLERSTLPIDGGAEVLIERIAQPRASIPSQLSSTIPTKRRRSRLRRGLDRRSRQSRALGVR